MSRKKICVPSTGATLAAICDFVSLQIISFVIVLNRSEKLTLGNNLLKELSTLTKENNLQGNKITNSGQSPVDAY